MKILKRIKSVKNMIKYGIDNLKNEEKKKLLDKGKINQILNQIKKQSKNEV
jgi:hypothetical protein